MSFQSHPIVMATVVKSRQEEFLAEADGLRLSMRAERASGAVRGPRWFDPRAVIAVVAVLALLLAAGSAASAEEPPLTSAVQKVREATS